MCAKHAAKAKPEKATCPCCGKERGREQLRKILGRKYKTWGGTSVIEDIGWLSSWLRNWACDVCLKEGKAAMGNPDVQRYCDYTPYFMYVDRPKQCRSCGKDFFFTRSEQKYWYETLQFWVQSEPKQCAPCRKAIRRGRRLQANLAELLAQPKPYSASQWRAIAEAHRAVGNVEKAAEAEKQAAKKERN